MNIKLNSVKALLILFSLSFVLASCGKDITGCTDPLATNYNPDATISDGNCQYPDPEGCTNPNAVNYDPNAVVDDGSCSFASDQLVGNWSVVESVSGNTESYTAVVTRLNNDSIRVTSNRTNPPNYHLSQMDLLVEWTDKKVSNPGFTITGTITDKDNFVVQYSTGSAGTIYNVVQTYNR